MIDKMLDTLANFMNKSAAWMKLPTLPWDRFRTDWDEFVTIIAPWNKIFPLSDLMTITGLCVAFGLALIAFYTIVLIKSFIPMSGGK